MNKTVGLNRQRGVGLVELLVGLAIGLLIMAGAITLFAKISFSGLENTRRVQLNEQLRSTLNLMHKDIQRAGYVDATDGATTVDDVDTVQMALFGVITIGNAAGEAANSCIIYSYDFNGDNIQDPDEIFGFRLSGTVIQRDTTSAFCAGTAADDGWQSFTDDAVVVQALTFSDDSSVYFEVSRDGDGDPPCQYDGFYDGIACVDTTPCDDGETCLARRKIDVAISGYVAQEDDDGDVDTDPPATALVVSLSDEIKVKNDRYYLVPAAP